MTEQQEARFVAIYKCRDIPELDALFRDYCEEYEIVPDLEWIDFEALDQEHRHWLAAMALRRQVLEVEADNLLKHGRKRI